MVHSLYIQWLHGDALDVGHQLITSLPPGEQVSRCCAVLEACRSVTPFSAEVQRVVSILGDAQQWRLAHDAFRHVRRLTLRGEAARSQTPAHLLLYVAEIATRTVYNASGPPDPFDSDSPCWLAPNARAFALAAGSQALTDRLWKALSGTAR